VEVGAVYTTTVATQGDFHADGFVVKLTLRY
jgi:hypothetical protein